MSTCISAIEMVGRSRPLHEVLQQVNVVAAADTTVLILGETGTGKELVATAVHDASPRRQNRLVKVNCAAIPAGLLESELLGHERGAFTGAVVQRIGRFEAAHGGTLFLDEIGDIPLDLQAKLLRIIQEKQFERLGSGKTIKVNVRIVAATHRNLRQMVNEGSFRADLFYRLHVFPIRVPALRDRPEDIPHLVKHFVSLFARQMDKHIETISESVMQHLCRYSWPGNIRELQNFVERSVILSGGPVLEAPVWQLGDEAPAFEPAPRTLLEVERDCIRRTLQEVGWRVGGADGAAARLGVPRTTLLYRIRRLGIVPPVVEAKQLHSQIA
ncbi:MAG: sigma 54-interacting transcriptional regulator [Bryobacteraceae bacterium]|nr:sigma 54-interacting transcriptional regulator [Bryobacteraceae bacterium]